MQRKRGTQPLKKTIVCLLSPDELTSAGLTKQTDSGCHNAVAPSYLPCLVFFIVSHIWCLASAFVHRRIVDEQARCPLNVTFHRWWSHLLRCRCSCLEWSASCCSIGSITSVFQGKKLASRWITVLFDCHIANPSFCLFFFCMVYLNDNHTPS